MTICLADSQLNHYDYEYLLRIINIMLNRYMGKLMMIAIAIRHLFASGQPMDSLYQKKKSNPYFKN